MRTKTSRTGNKPRGKSPSPDSAAKLATLLKQAAEIERYSLRLFVTGTTRRSTLAIANIRSFCEQFLPGRYDLEVVDIYQRPAETISEQIIAVPTLIKKLPKPSKRLIGDLSDRDKLMTGLNFVSSKAGHEDGQK